MEKNLTGRVKKMIQAIQSFEKYEFFIGELAGDPIYSDPHFTFDKDNLYRSLERQDEYAFAVLENGEPEGLFVWLVLPEDHYIEMIVGLTKNEEAFSEMLVYMEENYPGFHMDLVLNPLNTALSRPLKERGAAFDPEQQKMIQNGIVPGISTDQVVLISEKWTLKYYEIHNKETYWTAERVLANRDNFRVLLAVKDGQILGYLDVTCGYEVNEIYDLFVRPEAARQGLEAALLAKAIELNSPHSLMVVVDVDTKEEIELFTAAGSCKMEGQNSIAASYRLETV